MDKLALEVEYNKMLMKFEEQIEALKVQQVLLRDLIDKAQLAAAGGIFRTTGKPLPIQ
jgi:hypothetical protein